MKRVENIQDMLELRRILSKDSSIGFVPTMGALHAGHLDLVSKAKKENSIVFVSIFVNPTQFNDPKDLEKYPRNLEKDEEMLRSVGCDFLFYPNYDEIYPDGYRYKISENDFSKMLCGAHRPGHFDGVLTVVMKLLHIVQPNKAYFGQKDYQQLQLIKGMTEAFFMNTEIVECPTIRESDGLAMSSRNQRLSDSDRKKAPELYKVITQSKTNEEAREKLSHAGFKVDYVETINGRRYAAAFLGDVRLIDNTEVKK